MDNNRDIELLRGYLEDYLRQKGIGTRKVFRCLSPDHEDKHPSMGFNRGAGNVHCFACGVTYDLFDLIGMDYGLSGFPARLEKAAELFGVTLERPARKPCKAGPAVGPVDVAGLPAAAGTETGDKPATAGQQANAPVQAGASVGQNGGTNRLVHLVSPGGVETGPVDRPRQAAEAALEQLQQDGDPDAPYLLGRGIPRALVYKYGLFQKDGRAYFPIREGGELAGWCGRAVDDKAQPRYKNSTGALGLWNGDLLREPGAGRPLYITEGILDALSLEAQGCHAIALCGSQNGNKLLERLRDNPSAAGWRFVLCGDGDEAGQRMNEALGEGLAGLGLPFATLAPEDGDWNDMLRQRPERLAALLREVPRLEDAVGAAYNATSAAAGLDAFFAHRESQAGRDGVSTGFSGMDKLLDGGLYPGLYVLGAASSLGKTSLVLQIADYIAAGERDVLFISLEQGRFELMAKSLSRLSAELAGEGVAPFTTRDLLSGQPEGSMARRQLLLDCRAAYGATAGGLFLREGIGDIGAAEIRGFVQEHVARRGTAPVVVVDYLQILAAADPRMTDKQNVDKSVVALKRLSRDFEIPVVAISSLNREGYKAPVSMEAFKESGAVEYSADVLLGLQLLGAGGKDFDANAAKAKHPRQLELVVLKNRNGVPYAKLRLAYDARYNRFWQAGAGASAVDGSVWQKQLRQSGVRVEIG